MPDSEPGERARLLNRGSIYRVTRDVPPGISAFKQGERIVFQGAGHSPYDNAYIFTFTDAEGARREYLLADVDPIERLTNTFIAVEGA